MCINNSWRFSQHNVCYCQLQKRSACCRRFQYEPWGKENQNGKRILQNHYRSRLQCERIWWNIQKICKRQNLVFIIRLAVHLKCWHRRIFQKRNWGFRILIGTIVSIFDWVFPSVSLPPEIFTHLLQFSFFTEVTISYPNLTCLIHSIFIINLQISKKIEW